MCVNVDNCICIYVCMYVFFGNHHVLYLRIPVFMEAYTHILRRQVWDGPILEVAGGYFVAAWGAGS